MDEIEIKKQLYRYKTLYEIELEENMLLKENCLRLNEQIIKLNQKMQENENRKSIFYRGLRKIYHKIKKR